MTSTLRAPRPADAIDAATGWAFLLAPLCLLVAWTVLWPLDGRDGPGVGWTVAHVAWVAAFCLLAPACLALRRMIGGTRTLRTVATVTTGAALAGLAAGVAQMVVDLVAGFGSSTRAELDRRSDALTDLPGVDLVLYTVGPILFFVALLVLFVLMAARSRIGAWAPALVGTGFVLVAADVLAPLGIVALGVPLAVVGARLLRAHPPVGGAFSRRSARR